MFPFRTATPSQLVAASQLATCMQAAALLNIPYDQLIPRVQLRRAQTTQLNLGPVPGTLWMGSQRFDINTPNYTLIVSAAALLRIDPRVIISIAEAYQQEQAALHRSVVVVRGQSAVPPQPGVPLQSPVVQVYQTPQTAVSVGHVHTHPNSNATAAAAAASASAPQVHVHPQPAHQAVVSQQNMFGPSGAPVLVSGQHVQVYPQPAHQAVVSQQSMFGHSGAAVLVTEHHVQVYHQPPRPTIAVSQQGIFSSQPSVPSVPSVTVQHPHSNVHSHG